jgi:hypothetical protein
MRVALSLLGERVDRDGAFASRRGPGLCPPKGLGHPGRTAGYGPQAGEWVTAQPIRGNGPRTANKEKLANVK